MAKTNRRGEKQIGPKMLPPDLYDHLKDFSEKNNLDENQIVIDALRLHKEKNDKLTRS